MSLHDFHLGYKNYFGLSASNDINKQIIISQQAGTLLNFI